MLVKILSGVAEGGGGELLMSCLTFQAAKHPQQCYKFVVHASNPFQTITTLINV